jgi:hypothetical protein
MEELPHSAEDPCNPGVPLCPGYVLRGKVCCTCRWCSDSVRFCNRLAARSDPINGLHPVRIFGICPHGYCEKWEARTGHGRGRAGA